MLDFWQPGQDEGLAGCDSPHVLGGHGDHAVHQQFGRLAGVQSLPVRVGAPVGHRAEGRVKPRVVYPTSWDAARQGTLGQSVDPVFDVRPSTSRGTGSNLEHIEEELFDYDEEVETPVASVPKGCVKEMPRVVQKVRYNRRVGMKDVEEGERGCGSFHYATDRVWAVCSYDSGSVAGNIQVGICSSGRFPLISFSIACGFEDGDPEVGVGSTLLWDTFVSDWCCHRSKTVG
ncbi:hypothetical protein NDU88_004781 [Pleurodeles waltl]|uniref:Uncharacterized protein n=1 Tax=Pleurodeles waltl TaxID=8319 RepID=A0AAV7QJC8_PLEWA|nr:hypothetical protein NDU88_004781 [Pleurodeles waltl]